VGATTEDKRVNRLLKMWHLQTKPGVLTASLFMLSSVDGGLVLRWPGLRVFVAAQVGLMLIVVFAVALVDAGRTWDNRLFDDLYRPSGTFEDGRERVPGRYLQRERPCAGLFPSGPALTKAREQASAAIDHPMQDLYSDSREFLELSPGGGKSLTQVDGPLELSKGLRALLAPLAIIFVVGVVVAAGTYLTGSRNWATWAWVAGAAVVVWPVLAYVFVQQRHEHMVRLYKEVARAANARE